MSELLGNLVNLDGSSPHLASMRLPPCHRHQHRGEHITIACSKSCGLCLAVFVAHLENLHEPNAAIRTENSARGVGEKYLALLHLDEFKTAFRQYVIARFLPPATRVHYLAIGPGASFCLKRIFGLADQIVRKRFGALRVIRDSLEVCRVLPSLSDSAPHLYLYRVDGQNVLVPVNIFFAESQSFADLCFTYKFF